MSKIEKVVRYRVRGVEYNTIEQAIDALEEQVLRYVRSIDPALNEPLSARQQLSLTKALLSHRVELRDLLDFSSDRNQFDEGA